jgi:hypothetical protein
MNSFNEIDRGLDKWENRQGLRQMGLKETKDENENLCFF